MDRRSRVIVIYRALAGGEYLARVLCRRADGLIDIELDGSGLTLSRIVAHADPDQCQRGEAYGFTSWPVSRSIMPIRRRCSGVRISRSSGRRASAMSGIKLIASTMATISS